MLWVSRTRTFLHIADVVVAKLLFVDAYSRDRVATVHCTVETDTVEREASGEVGGVCLFPAGRHVELNGDGAGLGFAFAPVGTVSRPALRG